MAPCNDTRVGVRPDGVSDARDAEMAVASSGKGPIGTAGAA